MAIFDRLPATVRGWLGDAVIRDGDMELVAGLALVRRLGAVPAEPRTRWAAHHWVRSGAVRAWEIRVVGYAARRRVMVTTLVEVLGAARGLTVRAMLRAMRDGGLRRPAPAPDAVLAALYAAGYPGRIGDTMPPSVDIDAACAVAAAERGGRP